MKSYEEFVTDTEAQENEEYLRQLEVEKSIQEDLKSRLKKVNTELMNIVSIFTEELDNSDKVFNLLDASINNIYDAIDLLKKL